MINGDWVILVCDVLVYDACTAAVVDGYAGGFVDWIVSFDYPDIGAVIEDDFPLEHPNQGVYRFYHVNQAIPFCVILF